MSHRTLHLGTILALAACLLLPAQDQPAERKLTFQSGTVTVGAQLATIVLPAGTRYLQQQDARHVVEQVWGNPPDEGTLGLILPDPAAGPEGAAPQEWGIVVSYEEQGHVKDDDAAAIDYTALLKQMQEGSAGQNEARTKAGYPTVDVLGWAEPPHYDSSSHKMYWAKSLRFGGQPEPQLNYCVRVLGAKGVLELNAVDAVANLKPVAEASKGVLAGVQLASGHRYEDFKPGIDPVMAGGIAALVAGGFAAKKGLLVVIGLFLLKGWKLVLLGGAAIAAVAGKVLGRKGSDAA